MAAFDVLYDSQVFVGLRYGGVGRYFFELVRALPSLDPELSLEVRLGLHRSRYAWASLASPRVRISGRHLIEFPRSIRAVTALNTLALAPRLRFRPPRVFHPTYYAPFPRRLRSKKVLTVHDFTHEKFPSSFPASDRTAAQKRLAVAGADALIAVSHATKRDLVERLGVPEERVTVVHLASALGVGESRKAASHAPGRPYLLFVGPRAGYKNFEALLTAVANAPRLAREFSVTCFGGAPEWSMQERAGIARVEAAGGEVLRRGGDDDALRDAYAHAAALVYPSKSEGFGLPLLEAFESGCPVIAANTTSLPEVGGDAAEWFDPEQPDELAAALMRVLGSNDVRAPLVARGRLRARAFSWEACARRTLEVYRG